MLNSKPLLRALSLVVAVALLGACSPELVAKDSVNSAPIAIYPDAHDFALPMMN